MCFTSGKGLFVDIVIMAEKQIRFAGAGCRINTQLAGAKSLHMMAVGTPEVFRGNAITDEHITRPSLPAILHHGWAQPALDRPPELGTMAGAAIRNSMPISLVTLQQVCKLCASFRLWVGHQEPPQILNIYAVEPICQTWQTDNVDLPDTPEQQQPPPTNKPPLQPHAARFKFEGFPTATSCS